MKFVFIVVSFLMGLSAHSVERKVPIATTDGKVQLINGSAHPMSYTIKCFDKSDGTTQIVNESFTLQPKREKIYDGGANFCAAGSTMSKKVGTGSAILCQTGSQITYANRATACGSNAHVCKFEEVTDQSGLSSKSDNYFAFDPPTASPWSRWDGKSWYDVADGTTTYKPTTYYTTYYNCATATAGGGTVNNNCHAYYDTKAGTYYAGAVCCPNNAGYSSCEVTVDGSNHVDGFLQSPQYKGGKAF